MNAELSPFEVGAGRTVNVLAEQCIIGALAVAELVGQHETAPAIFAMVRPEHFAVVGLRRLYEGALAARREDQPLNGVTISYAAIRLYPDWDGPGSLQWCSKAVAEVPAVDPVSARAYAAIVIECAERRRLMREASELARKANSGEIKRTGLGGWE